MRTVELQHELVARTFHVDGGPGDASSDDALEAARTAARNLRAGGHEAVQRALSGDSSSFLRSARQQGGE